MDTERLTAEIIGDTYTRILHKALHISWQEHFTNKNLGKLPLVSSKIKFRRIKMAGHCIRHHELPPAHSMGS